MWISKHTKLSEKNNDSKCTTTHSYVIFFLHMNVCVLKLGLSLCRFENIIFKKQKKKFIAFEIIVRGMYIIVPYGLLSFPGRD